MARDTGGGKHRQKTARPALSKALRRASYLRENGNRDGPRAVDGYCGYWRSESFCADGRRHDSVRSAATIPTRRPTHALRHGKISDGGRRTLGRIIRLRALAGRYLSLDGTYGESFGHCGHICHSIGGCVLGFMEEMPSGRGCFHDTNRVDTRARNAITGRGARDIGEAAAAALA